jgi:hypothetical protein
MARWDADWFTRLYSLIADLPFRKPEEQREIRRTLSTDPVAFSIIYLRKHLMSKEVGGRPSFSEVHLEWARYAEGWKTGDTVPEPRSNRHAFIAPRGMGKSTWWFLILPLWAAAHGHIRFAAAFAHSAGQAETHLQTMKTELDTNILLREDFPDLCAPARRPTGTTVADRQGMIHQLNGFTFAAKGIDATSLGLKVGADRPDLLILDDIEPGEETYSAYLAVKRLGAVLDSILPLNIYANVALIGTVTMPDSITHQVVRAAGGVSTADWISDEKIQCHHHLPIEVNDDGTERSVWPEKWPLSLLQEMRHTRAYAKNYLNDPMARDGQYWNREDIRYGTVEAITKVGLFIDPAVTTKEKSDFTGMAVVGFSPARGMVEVMLAKGVKMIGSQLRDEALRIITEFPQIQAVVIEVNQGGELWKEVFHDMPVKVSVYTVSEKKEVRFGWALEHYQARRVLHTAQHPILEGQMIGFPKAPNDDVADAAVAGVLRFLSPPKKIKAGVTSATYM